MLKMDERDSDVVWRAASPGKSHITSGVSFGPNQLRRVSGEDRKLFRKEVVDRIVELDLGTAGVGEMRPWPDRFGDGTGGLFEVFVDGERMPLARYPNVGNMKMKRVTQNTPGVFEWRDDRHRDWTDAIERGGLWLQGYWRVPWQVDTVRVAKQDADQNLVYHSTKVALGIGNKYKRPQGNGAEPYIAINLPEEIDMPGEWAVDFITNKLYFLPVVSPDEARITIASSKEPLFELKGANRVALKGLTLEVGRSDGIVVNDGEGVSISQCTFRYLGKTAVRISGGRKHTVERCHIYEIGGGGIVISGGDRTTLTPCHHEARDNHIHHFARTQKIYAAGIQISGVGVKVRHNEIHDTPHLGVGVSGNEHLLEYNNVYHFAQVSNDMGGFYSVLDWAGRGNVYRYNLIHSSPSGEGIYFDDGQSGALVYGNVLYRLHTGIFVGGGHDNISRGNIAVDCSAGYHLDARGIHRNYTAENPKRVHSVAQFNHKEPPWSKAYPEMVDILENHPERPTGTMFKDNLAIDCRSVLRLKDKPYLNLSIIDNNVAGDDDYSTLDSLVSAITEGNLKSVAPQIKHMAIDQAGPRNEEGIHYTYVDSESTRYRYDFGTNDSPVGEGWSPVTPEARGHLDISSGINITAIDRGSQDAVDPVARDFMTGYGTSKLRHKVSNGMWEFTVQLPDAVHPRGELRVKAEGIAFSLHVEEAGVPTQITGSVEVKDGELNIDFLGGDFFGTGESNSQWAVAALSLVKMQP
ncbi:right-handed parallel beta-helix repeat-containing protein [Rhodopirellula sallentina]|uniref:Right handed beta helix domain-containing protein n=1 Tax=Rhodopirellula sallentina SM41 TaxID=1263870 RepID=M5U9J2_9BACT|nr:right-handed parallel beta-helix repeat-containing protein [Rhodopirellula sallentina]EMI52658.1 hypothetical protein RSSM_05875 [Rhodopirellula sallentina SM41]